MKKIVSKTIVATVKVIRELMYKGGLRPKRGSIFYSQSLNALYTLKRFLRDTKRN